MSNALNNHHKNLVLLLITCIFVPNILGIFTPIFSYNEYYEQDNRFSYFMSKSYFSPSICYVVLYNIILCMIYANIGFFSNNQIAKSEHFIQVISSSMIHMILITFTLGIQFNYKSMKPRPTFFHYCDYQGFKDGVLTGDFSKYFELTSRTHLIDISKCSEQHLDMYEFLPQNVLYITGNFIMLFQVLDKSRGWNINKLIIITIVFVMNIGIIYLGYSNAEYDIFDILRGVSIGICLGFIIGNQSMNTYKKYIDEKCSEDCAV